MKEIDPTDLIVGKNIKKARIENGLSQDDVGEYLGVTFQQVQKYEKGLNGVSASKLVIISTKLGKPLGWFFDENLSDIGKTTEGQKMTLRVTKLVMAVQGRRHFKAIVALIEALSGPENE